MTHGMQCRRLIFLLGVCKVMFAAYADQCLDIDAEVAEGDWRHSRAGTTCQGQWKRLREFHSWQAATLIVSMTIDIIDTDFPFDVLCVVEFAVSSADMTGYILLLL